MSVALPPEAERSPWCSICYDPLGTDDPARTLEHVLHQHPDHPDVTDFIESIEVGQHCAKCGQWFYSDVQWSPSGVFTARPYCQECRESSRALKRLMTERLTIREVLARGWPKGTFTETNNP